jgi:hypothetical protein
VFEIVAFEALDLEAFEALDFETESSSLDESLNESVSEIGTFETSSSVFKCKLCHHLIYRLFLQNIIMKHNIPIKTMLAV